MLDICGNDIECNVITFDPECEEILPSSNTMYSSMIKKRRELNYDISKLLRSSIMTMNDISTKSKRDMKMNDGRNKTKIKKKKEKIELKFNFLGNFLSIKF